MKRTTIAATIAMLVAFVSSARATQTWWMHGGNWADARDNFLDGWIIPSGLTASSTSTDCQNKANQIANDIIGITDSTNHVVRLGINPQSVGDSTWWPKMQVYINQLTSRGFHVILACWDGSDGDGKINDTAAWKTMWQKVSSVYGGNYNVWFEPFNEPHYYSTSSLISLYNDYLSWIGKDQQRIILDGTGYSDTIYTIGSHFGTCKFGLHVYAWWATNSESGWATYVQNRIGGYQDRTLITEMGAPATTGVNYGASSSDNTVSYIRGVTQQARSYQIGIVYWPTHRDNDSYRLFVNTTGGGITNTSLKDRLRYGWNY